MGKRAPPSGHGLTSTDAAIIRGMLARGDRHHDVAAFFGVNQGRIAEVKDGALHPGVAPVAPADLPPRGPYLESKSEWEKGRLI